MNADLLAMLGGAGIPGSSSRMANDEGKTILSFKAGKMTSVQQPNAKYLITPDMRRGEIRLIYRPSSRNPAIATTPSASNLGTLQFSWKDRRTQSISDELTVFAWDRITFKKVKTGNDNDRVYLLQYGSNSERRYFYWMQYLAKEEDEKTLQEMDDHNVHEMNKFLSDLSQSAIAAGDTAAENTTTTTSEPAPAAATTEGVSSSSSQQVDALSNILENLGMPQPSSSAQLPSAASGTPSSATSANGGTLTLADLQGAMATLATSSPSPAPSLTDIISHDAVENSQILDDPLVLDTLLPLLPENQRTKEHLKDNLRSPQFQESLKSLQGVLAGSPDGLSTIMANFQLDMSGTDASGLSGKSPVEIFLEGVQKAVKNNSEEKEDVKDEEEKDEEMKE